MDIALALKCDLYCLLGALVLCFWVKLSRRPFRDLMEKCFSSGHA